MQKNWLYNVLFAQRKISNWITSENNKKGIFSMHMNICTYMHVDTYSVENTIHLL